MSSGIPDERRRYAVSRPPVDEHAYRALLGYVRARERGDQTPFHGMELDLRGADLRYLDLRGAWLMRARLDGVDLSHSLLDDAVFNEASVRGARFDRADLVGATMNSVEAAGAGFHGAEMAGVEAVHGNLRSTDMRGAHLRGAQFIRCDLTAADLGGSTLEMTTLFHSRLAGSVVEGTHGTVFDTCYGDDGELLEGKHLETWLRARGAAVRVLRARRGQGGPGHANP